MGLQENAILSKMAQIGISRQTFALLLDISETVVCRGLNCTKPFAGPDIERMNKTLNALIRIQEIIYPLQIPTTDTARLKVLLAKYHDDGLDQLMSLEKLTALRQQLELLNRAAR